MEEDKGTSSWYRVPTWDGSPATWRAFRREMAWWVESLDLEQSLKFNLAARWLLRQSGVVRQRGEEFDPKELEAKKLIKRLDPDTNTEVVVQEADPLYGLNKLLAALEGINGKSELDKKGELREQFYNSLKRRPGERISEFCTRFRTLAADLRSEGIQLPAAEQGWFLREKLGLDGIRKQLLETALGGVEDYDAVEREVLRLFKDLHSADPLQRRSFGGADGKPSLMHRFLTGSGSSSGRPSTFASSSTGSSLHRPFKSSASSVSSRFSGKSRMTSSGTGRQAYAAEAEVVEDAEDGEEEMIPDEVDKQEASLEEVLQAEAAMLASDLENLEAEGAEPELLEELEAGVENAAEALVSMREARHKINEMKRDRGYGRSSAGSGDRSSKPHGNQVSRAKATTTCFDCGLPGHWKGDKECTKPGAGLGRKDAKRSGGKQVMISESMNTECLIPSSLTLDDGVEPHEVHAVSAVRVPLNASLSEALASSQMASALAGKAPQLELSSDKKLVGALDSACNRTVTGSTWLSGFLQALRKAPVEVRALVQRQPENEMFRFGNGGVQQSCERWRLPMVLGDQLFLFWTSVVDVPSLGLLFGRDFLDGVGAVLNFNRRLLRCDRLDTGHIPLRQLAAGHFLLEIIPKQWIRPGTQRWRKFGQDGIVELQLSFGDWLKKRFGEPSHSFPKEHEHLVTESSFHAAQLINSGLQQVAHQPPNLAALARDVMTLTSQSNSSTTSPPTRKSHDVRDQMGTAAKATRASSRLAHPGLVALAAAATCSALGSIALPSRGRFDGLAGPGRDNGGQSMPPSSACDKGPASWSLQRPELGGCDTPEKPNGFPVGVFGGPHADGHAGGTSFKRNVPQDPICGADGSQGGSKEIERVRKTTGSCAGVDWSAWRTSNPSSRPSEACCLAPLGSQREGHQCNVANNVPASRGFAE